MRNEHLMKKINKDNGFWVKLNDLERADRTGIAAKILIKEGFLTLYTLLYEAPAINIYNSNQFVFVSTDKEVILKLRTKGEIYDWWGEDSDRDVESYIKTFLNIWQLDELEYEKYSDENEIEKLPEIMITGLIQE